VIVVLVINNYLLIYMQ